MENKNTFKNYYILTEGVSIMRSNVNFNTKIIHNCQTEKEAGAIVQPIVPAVAYSFDCTTDAQHATKCASEIHYGRYGNETTKQLEQKIASLEEADDALAVSSGMAAISIALLSQLKSGDHVLVTKDLYGGTYSFLTKIASRYNIEYDYIDCTDTNTIEQHIKDNTKVIFIETPSNPTLTILDIEAISHVAKKHHLKVIIDNTFMSPYLQRPLTLGADIIVHSATKYLNGHGDVVAGLICGSNEDIAFMRQNIMGELGQNLNAWDAFLILRGIKTLSVRMDRHCENAKAVFHYLNTHPFVKNVYFPGDENHPQKETIEKQMADSGAVVSFEIDGDSKMAEALLNHLKLIIISFSLGDPETLIQHPASMTHSAIPVDELHKFNLTESLIRLSVGLEAAEDIINDLDQAFDKVKEEFQK